MMGQFEQLDQMLTAQEGMLRTSQVVSSGISKPVFYDYVRSRDLDRVAHGDLSVQRFLGGCHVSASFAI